jgi:putative ABC transport system substrate-binding protein
MRRRAFISLIGGAIAWPLAAPAQTAQVVKRVAIADPVRPTTEMIETANSPFFRGFFSELRRLGYVEGQNLIVERYSGHGSANLPELAREVVRTKPDLILGFSRRLVQQLATATSEIPIIVGGTLDPVGYGIANSLARPRRNLTGITQDAGLAALTKHIELLQSVAPRASRIGFLAPEEAWGALYGRQMQEAARQMGVTLVGPGLTYPIQESEYRRVISAMEKMRPDAIIVGDITDNVRYARVIVELVSQLRVPAIYPDRDFIEAGGLMAYTVSFADRHRIIADYVVKVLTGTKPGDLPFQQPTKWLLIVNLKGAKELHLEFPPELLVLADKVIE